MGELSKLKGLGPKSERCLNEIGIHTVAELKAIGPMEAFVRLCNEGHIKPSLNFLYALVGALEDRSWQEIARNEKTQLLLELQDYQELREFFLHSGHDGA